jgi:hypothetical protein
LKDLLIKNQKFKTLFYPYGENFGIEKEVACKKEYFEYITFLAPYRSVCNKNFSLLDTILNNIESNLNVSRNCFTTASLIELNNEIISIHSLCDINCCSVLASLPWSNIEDLIKNDALSNDPSCHCPSQKQTLCFVISVLFKTPTPGVKPSMIKFPYIIKND